MSEHLPLTLDVEEVRIEGTALGGWEIVLKRDGDEDIVVYQKMPDPVYDQLVEAGDIELYE